MLIRMLIMMMSHHSLPDKFPSTASIVKASGAISSYSVSDVMPVPAQEPADVKQQDQSNRKIAPSQLANPDSSFKLTRSLTLSAEMFSSFAIFGFKSELL